MIEKELIEDLLSALEYHTEQTRPIEFSKVAIEAAREHLRKPAQQERSDTRPCRSCDGTGERFTGIDEAPTSICKPCKGTGQIALAEQPAQQEPVAWEQFYPDIGKPQLTYPPQGIYYTPPQQEPDEEEYLAKAYRMANELRCHLAIAPAPQRTWVGLTDEEIANTWAESIPCYYEDDFARAIEAKLRSKNA